MIRLKRKHLEKPKTSLEDQTKQYIPYEKRTQQRLLIPFMGKVLAWILSLTCIFTCSTLLMIYGTTFGAKRSLVWISTVFASMAFSTLLIQPLKIFAVAFLASFVILKKSHICHKPLPRKMLLNVYNKEEKQKVVSERLRLAKLYIPQDWNEMRTRKPQVRRLTQLQELTWDMIFHVVFSLCIYLIIYLNQSPNAYYSNRAMKNLVVHASYTKTIPMTKVMHYEHMIEYINTTLLPALLQNETEWLAENEDNADNNSANGNLTGPVTHIWDRGYTRDLAFKLLGKPRMRQKRVTPESCVVDNASLLNRLEDCAADLNFWNEDTNNYSLGWHNIFPGEPEYDDVAKEPWTYRSAFQNDAFSIGGRLHSFLSSDGGGYILDLGKNLVNSRTVLDFLEYFNWIDYRTRTVLIEFTTYTVEDNLFNVVILIFEMSATADVIPSFKINTFRLLYGSDELGIGYGVVLFVFIGLIGFKAGRQIQRLINASWRLFRNELWDWVELMIALLGIVFIVLIMYNYNLISRVIGLRNKSRHNDYVSFNQAACISTVVGFILALMVFLQSLNVCRFFFFRWKFCIWETVIRQAGHNLASLSKLTLVLTFLLTIFFISYPRHHEEVLINFTDAFPFLFAIATKTDSKMDIKKFCMAAPIFGAIIFLVFAIILCIVVIFLFFMLLAVHYHMLRQEDFRDHYNLWLYLKNCKKGNLFDSPNPEDITLQKPIHLNPLRLADIQEPIYIDEARMQAMKRTTLQLLTNRGYLEETAINIAYLILTENELRPATAKFYIELNNLISTGRMIAMKLIANKVLRTRNKINSRKFRERVRY